MDKNKKGVKSYIDEKDLLEREKLISFLEKAGFVLDADEFRGRQGIIEGSLPVTVDMAKRTYRMMGNVTSAAGAASSGRIMTTEEFYSGRNWDN